MPHLTLPLSTLRRIATTRRAAYDGERCEMCAEPISGKYRHVVDLETQGLMCTCRGCYLLFTTEGAQQRHRAVPERYLSFPDFRPGPAQWDALEIPVGLAFSFRNSGVEQIPWDREVRYKMPVRVWRDLVAQSFPASGWLRLDHQTLAMLTAYKAARGLTTYDEAANDLLALAGEMAR